MIKEMDICGFKSFANQNLKIGSLTLLAGLNNCGKSSVIQSLRMYFLGLNNQSPLLPGHGQISDLRSDYVSSTSDISISLIFEDDSRDILTFSEQRLESPKNGPEFQYIGADRLGPQTFLPMNMSLDLIPKVGERGEFVFDYITKLEENGYLLPEALIHPKSQGKTFEYALHGWLSEISPGVQLSFSTNKQADIAQVEIDSYRPANVGFGLSYTLPIVAAVLGAVASPNSSFEPESWQAKWEMRKRENGFFIAIENPEAHLHPQGQTAMGKLIALAVACGVQILVETHSEHLMDGIRIAIKEGKIANNKVIFHYLRKSSDGRTIVTTPKIDTHGKLDSWPEGFFDQTLINRSLLAKRAK